MSDEEESFNDFEFEVLDESDDDEPHENLSDFEVIDDDEEELPNDIKSKNDSSSNDQSKSDSLTNSSLEINPNDTSTSESHLQIPNIKVSAEATDTKDFSTSPEVANILTDLKLLEENNPFLSGQGTKQVGEQTVLPVKINSPLKSAITLSPVKISPVKSSPKAVEPLLKEKPDIVCSDLSETRESNADTKCFESASQISNTDILVSSEPNTQAITLLKNQTDPSVSESIPHSVTTNKSDSPPSKLAPNKLNLETSEPCIEVTTVPSVLNSSISHVADNQSKGDQTPVIHDLFKNGESENSQDEPNNKLVLDTVSDSDAITCTIKSVLKECSDTHNINEKNQTDLKNEFEVVALEKVDKNVHLTDDNSSRGDTDAVASQAVHTSVDSNTLEKEKKIVSDGSPDKIENADNNSRSATEDSNDMSYLVNYPNSHESEDFDDTFEDFMEVDSVHDENLAQDITQVKSKDVPLCNGIDDDMETWWADEKEEIPPLIWIDVDASEEKLAPDQNEQSEEENEQLEDETEVKTKTKKRRSKMVVDTKVDVGVAGILNRIHKLQEENKLSPPTYPKEDAFSSLEQQNIEQGESKERKENDVTDSDNMYSDAILTAKIKNFLSVDRTTTLEKARESKSKEVQLSEIIDLENTHDVPKMCADRTVVVAGITNEILENKHIASEMEFCETFMFKYDHDQRSEQNGVLVLMYKDETQAKKAVSYIRNLIKEVKCYHYSTETSTEKPTLDNITCNWNLCSDPVPKNGSHTSLMLANLPDTATIKSLKTEFPEALFINVPKKSSGQIKGYALLTFSNVRDARDAADIAKNSSSAYETCLMHYDINDRSDTRNADKPYLKNRDKSEPRVWRRKYSPSPKRQLSGKRSNYSRDYHSSSRNRDIRKSRSPEVRRRGNYSREASRSVSRDKDKYRKADTSRDRQRRSRSKEPTNVKYKKKKQKEDTVSSSKSDSRSKKKSRFQDVSPSSDDRSSAKPKQLSDSSTVSDKSKLKDNKEKASSVSDSKFKTKTRELPHSTNKTQSTQKEDSQQPDEHQNMDKIFAERYLSKMPEVPSTVKDTVKDSTKVTGKMIATISSMREKPEEKIRVAAKVFKKPLVMPNDRWVTEVTTPGLVRHGVPTSQVVPVDILHQPPGFSIHSPRPHAVPRFPPYGEVHGPGSMFVPPMVSHPFIPLPTSGFPPHVSHMPAPTILSPVFVPDRPLLATQPAPHIPLPGFRPFGEVFQPSPSSFDATPQKDSARDLIEKARKSLQNKQNVETKNKEATELEERTPEKTSADKDLDEKMQQFIEKQKKALQPDSKTTTPAVRKQSKELSASRTPRKVSTERPDSKLHRSAKHRRSASVSSVSSGSSSSSSSSSSSPRRNRHISRDKSNVKRQSPNRKDRSPQKRRRSPPQQRQRSPMRRPRSQERREQSPKRRQRSPSPNRRPPPQRQFSPHARSNIPSRDITPRSPPRPMPRSPNRRPQRGMPDYSPPHSSRKDPPPREQPRQSHRQRGSPSRSSYDEPAHLPPRGASRSPPPRSQHPHHPSQPSYAISQPSHHESSPSRLQHKARPLSRDSSPLPTSYDAPAPLKKRRIVETQASREAEHIYSDLKITVKQKKSPSEEVVQKPAAVSRKSPAASEVHEMVRDQLVKIQSGANIDVEQLSTLVEKLQNVQQSQKSKRETPKASNSGTSDKEKKSYQDILARMLGKYRLESDDTPKSKQIPESDGRYSTDFLRKSDIPKSKGELPGLDPRIRPSHKLPAESDTGYEKEHRLSREGQGDRQYVDITGDRKGFIDERKTTKTRKEQPAEPSPFDKLKSFLNEKMETLKYKTKIDDPREELQKLKHDIKQTRFPEDNVSDQRQIRQPPVASIQSKKSEKAYGSPKRRPVFDSSSDSSSDDEKYRKEITKSLKTKPKLEEPLKAKIAEAGGKAYGTDKDGGKKEKKGDKRLAESAVSKIVHSAGDKHDEKPSDTREAYTLRIPARRLDKEGQVKEAAAARVLDERLLEEHRMEEKRIEEQRMIEKRRLLMGSMYDDPALVRREMALRDPLDRRPLPGADHLDMLRMPVDPLRGPHMGWPDPYAPRPLHPVMYPRGPLVYPPGVRPEFMPRPPHPMGIRPGWPLPGPRPPF